MHICGVFVSLFCFHTTSHDFFFWVAGVRSPISRPTWPTLQGFARYFLISVDLFKQIFSDANSELYYLWAAMFGVDFLWCDDFLNYMFLSKLLRENQSSSKLRIHKDNTKKLHQHFQKKRKKQHIIFFGTTISTPEKHHIFVFFYIFQSPHFP